jgi:peptidyl-prolyl cis-trans isomerase B (cyclophilin B)
MIGAARQGANVNPEKKSSTQFYIVHGEVYTEEELKTNIEQLNSAFGRFLNDGEHEELKQRCLALQDSGLTEELQNLILDMRPEVEETLEMDFENVEITPEQIKVYTTIGGTPHLDGGYTVFGQVVEGMETVDKIASLEVDEDDNPVDPVFITLQVEEHPKDSLIAWYGIEYPIVEEEE